MSRYFPGVLDYGVSIHTANPQIELSSFDSINLADDSLMH
jgi:hypothetical protein